MSKLENPTGVLAIFNPAKVCSAEIIEGQDGCQLAVCYFVMKMRLPSVISRILNSVITLKYRILRQ
jgi:hypothetical protein